MNGGGTPEQPNCNTFGYTLVAGSYRIAEEILQRVGDHAGCVDFTVTYPTDSGQSLQYTATNSITGATAQACKVTTVTNGMGFDPSAYYFKFILKENGASVSTVLVRGGGSAASPNCATFPATSRCGDFVLQHNQTYTVVEDPNVYNSSGTQVSNSIWGSSWRLGA